MDGEGPSTDVIDPSTGDIHVSWPDASADQVDRAVTAAANAFAGWRDATQDERSEALRAIAAELASRREEIASALTRETGRAHSRNGLYVDMAVALFRQYAELARVDGGRIAPSNDRGQLSLIRRAPYGVVATLVPFNYPLLLLAFKVAPALATGNTLVVKPAPDTPLSLQVLAEVFAAHLPPGVLNTVRGAGEVGEALVSHPAVDLVAFTGSTDVGRRIAAACATRGTATHLELGGKDPAVVFADADPELAAEAVVWASFLNAGQVCTSSERVYVDRSIHEPFVDKAVRLAEKLRVGDPFDAATQVGPMRSARGRDRVLAQLRQATERGARVLVGGEVVDRPGFYLTPAVVTEVDHGMDLMRDETFGPVMPVMAFDDEDAAFALASDTPYGLGASIYTQTPRLVERAYRELRVGTVWVNDPVVDNLAAPFGGMGASGNARELGPEALDSFTRPRHVHWNLDLGRKQWWFREE
ncbi:MAG TPA: aldehyde dehydrogenase family protein [Acidimicrobiia bacterium]|nr:aldehyde dehydrogenase family protein [Acidimicrobiia bacterium]